MGNDPCTGGVWWSAITAASGDSTLAGVLAGLLIAAAAALLVGWYEESDPHTIALFGSGVPALAFSTYLFTVIAGMSFPPRDDHNDAVVSTVCSQMWSQWLLAMGLLFIGGAVLVCGLGWALVSYADNLAVKLCQRGLLNTVQGRRQYFIRLSGWLSGGVITTTIALLISANIVYVKTIPQGFLGSTEAKWYTTFSVFTLGILFILRSTYVAVVRTLSAQLANRRSCVAYAGAGVRPAPERRPMQRLRARASSLGGSGGRVVLAAKEFATVVLVALGAALAVHMTTTSSGRHYWAAPSRLVLLVVGLYVVARLTGGVIARMARGSAADNDDTSPNLRVLEAADGDDKYQRIRIKYSLGKLSVTTRCVVGLAILAAFFDVALTQGAFGTAQIVMSLLLGGVCPAVVLVGLSESIPAAKKGWWPLEACVENHALAPAPHGRAREPI
jgi:hypothetical protein